jgi:transcriptional regulator with XRE-family HTH domain
MAIVKKKNMGLFTVVCDTKKMKSLREAKGLEQTEVAGAAGISQSYLSKIEKFGETNKKTAQAIAKALGVPLEEILLDKARDLQHLLPPVPPRQIREERRAAPQPGLPTDLLALFASTTPDEQRTLLDIVPMLLTIYRAQEAGDEEAREAWEACRDKLMIVARALSVSLPRPTGKLGGRKPPHT